MKKKIIEKLLHTPPSEGVGEAPMKRVFVAIKIELLPELQFVFNQLKMKLKDELICWEPAEKLHLTLNFIGDVSPQQLKTLAALLEQTAANFTAFSFQLKNLSYFKRRGEPAVVFFDVEEKGELGDLVLQLKQRLDVAGVNGSHKFSPHVTLCRLKKLRHKDAFYEVMNQMNDTPAQIVRVQKMILFESILKSAGAEYHVLKEFNLG